MEGEFEFKRRGEVCPQLLNLIPTEDWMAKDTGGGGGGGCYGGDAEEKKLQLSLAPPGAERWPPQKPNRDDPSLLSLAKPSCSGTKRGFPIPQGFMHLQGMGGLGKELPFQRASGKMQHQHQQQQGLERKACCSPAAHGETVNAAGASSAAPHTRTASVPVVGWPPIRSFRRNLASSSSSKPLIQSQEEKGSDVGVKHENPRKGLFVKINMDGIPIGRKVDLKAHESYEKLSSAVEQLFRDLLAAQKDPPIAGVRKDEDNQVFTGLLDGTGEYTLVYEDNEGDRMLVGDVPWDMFVSTAKRLRVLKSSELSSLSLGLVGRKRRPSTDSSV